MAAPRRDFAVTLLDGRRVVGRYHDPSRAWSIYVYPPQPDDQLLCHGSAHTLPSALGQADLSGDDAGETLGRAGVYGPADLR